MQPRLRLRFSTAAQALTLTGIYGKIASQFRSGGKCKKDITEDWRWGSSNADVIKADLDHALSTEDRPTATATARPTYSWI